MKKKWEPSEFLNSDERRNSKTHYYIQLINNHDDIMLLVHNHSYLQILKHNTKGVFNKENIIWHRSYWDWKKLDKLLLTGKIKRLIIDNQEVDLRGFGYTQLIMTDDEIRDQVLTDMALNHKLTNFSHL